MECINRKTELLALASEYHKAGIYLPDKDVYVTGLRHRPDATWEYDNVKEPVVPHNDLYPDAADATLTVNSYNALVLNTPKLLIADVDFGDSRFDAHALGAEDEDDVIESLESLLELDRDDNFGVKNDDEPFVGWNDQSYRVYRTHSGCRIICTSQAYSVWDALPFLRFIGSDPLYIHLCRRQKCFRARLTPKPWRDCGDPCVCRLVHEQGNDIHHDLMGLLALHDELTIGDGTCSLA